MVPQESTTTCPITVTRDHAGWEVRHEVSKTETRIAHYTDWHRVELALRLIQLDPHASLLQSSAGSGRSAIES